MFDSYVLLPDDPLILTAQATQIAKSLEFHLRCYKS